MTTKSEDNQALPEASLSRMAENMKKVEELSERLTHVLTHRKTHQQALDGPNQAPAGLADPPSGSALRGNGSAGRLAKFPAIRIGGISWINRLPAKAAVIAAPLNTKWICRPGWR